MTSASAPEPCRLRGVEHGAWCGRVRRALDPERPHGTQIEVHFAVLPAVARNKRADPVFFFAGGPGQSALSLAGPASHALARFGNRRDRVLVDLRGTGRSAPLQCDDEQAALRPLAEQFDPELQLEQLRACRAELQKLRHGDLRRYTTLLAVQDVDAVRAAIGADRINLVGISYGTRAVLEYQRQFPARVRRAVVDGVAPADMALPASFSSDSQAALEAAFTGCENESACAKRHPQLRARWAQLLSGLPREVSLTHPVTGRAETLTLTRDMLLSIVRGPLYAPSMAAALPFAIDEAAQGRLEALTGLAGAATVGPEAKLAAGLHFSVVCSEDYPRLALASERPGVDFGPSFSELYRHACADWPRVDLPADFYATPRAGSPTLLLSGGLDPVTPPRHAERVAHALGANAVHVVVANAGHGVMSIGCMQDVVYRFVDAERDPDALRVDASCVQALPRAPAFLPPGAVR